MPTPPSRRIRTAVLATCAVGAIGLGTAGIVAGQSSSDEQTTSLTATAAEAPAADTLSEDALAAEESPAATVTTTPPASPSATASPTVKPSKKATTKPSPSPSRTTKKTKRPSPSPSKTTRTAEPEETGAASNSGSARVTEVIKLVNAERKKAGCGTLAGESRLHAAAQKHSELQAEKNTMSHQLPGEAGMGDRVTAEGYRWGGVAENVAAGYTTPASVMDGWMNSPGHKANILNCGYKHIGVGVAKSSKGTLYWTQNFASPL
ncbi:CAP domain-containing protein [Actinoplanes sp. NPDC024001]|uniref:CAP domain-containing protein n=1 Tax=Actinoplanes sp. NPDC024001 TaxID=3154598 RepID=UPI0033EABD26